jgi:CelD/BcsL family acetyltransferase involved in cellulose biosynthesis
MESRLVRIKDLAPTDERLWRELATRAVEPNPFFEPDFLVPSSRLFEGFSHTTLVIAQDRDRFCGLLPIAGVGRRRIPPRMVATTRGYPTAVTGLCTPLIDPTQMDSTVDTLLHSLGRAAARDGWPGIVSLDRLGDGGPVAATLRRSARRLGMPVFAKDGWSCGSISRTEGWSVVLDGHRRRELGRIRRKLIEHLGTPISVVDRSADAGAVDEFLEMEATGWKGRVVDNGAFLREPAKVEWFREWRERWASAGRLLLLSLQAGDTAIAMLWSVWAGDRLICFRIAYDDAYARFAPGVALFFDALEYVRDNTDAQSLDTYTDRNNNFFLDILPERQRITMLLIGTGGAVDRSMVAALPGMERVVARSSALRTQVLAARGRGGTSDVVRRPRRAMDRQGRDSRPAEQQDAGDHESDV